MPHAVNSDLVGLARKYAVTPARCSRCGATEATGAYWHIGEDDGRDRNYVGYECQHCGNITGLTRQTIMRKVRKAINGDSHRR